MWCMRAFLLMLGGLSLVAGCKQKEQNQYSAATAPIEVDVFVVRLKTLPATFEYTGVVQSHRSNEVRSRVEGVLTDISFKEGQLVNKGDLLYEIDPRPYEAALQNAQGELAAEESTLWNAKRTVERLEPIYEQKAASRKDFEDALAAERIAEAKVASARARVQQAELDLSYTKIYAPITGLSGESSYGPGALITKNDSKYLMKISTIDDVYVSFHISESEMLKQRREMREHLLKIPDDNSVKVKLTLADDTAYPYEGELDFTEPTFRPETGTRMMRALFPNPEELLRPGQFVRVTLTGGTWPNAIAIPQRAVLQGSNGMYVYLAKEGKAVIQPIKVGEWYEDSWIINSGLHEGDLVIVSSLDQLDPQSPIIVASTLN